MYSKDESLTTPESLRGKTIAGPTGTNLHELLVSCLLYTSGDNRLDRFIGVADAQDSLGPVKLNESCFLSFFSGFFD